MSQTLRNCRANSQVVARLQSRAIFNPCTGIGSAFYRTSLARLLFLLEPEWCNNNRADTRVENKYPHTPSAALDIKACRPTRSGEHSK